MDETMLLYGIAVVLIGGIMTPFILRSRRQERVAEEAEAEAKELGLDEPATLHPVVDVTRCISTGSCIDVCPEGDVLVMKNGQAHPVQPACCVGHGLGERSCPVDAIQLVFGTSKRGVDLPRIKGNFESNVPGLYIVGELAGMGLIRNAFEQGKQVVDNIIKEGSISNEVGAADILVVGCGPAGLATSLYAMERGLGLTTIEREDIGGTVRLFPRKKLVMTRPLSVPGYGRLTGPEIVKERLIDIWGDIVHNHAVQFARPQVAIEFDNDPKAAVATRKKIFAKAAKEKLLVAGMHLPFPGIGHVRKETSGYSWVPIDFAPLPD